MFGLAMVATLLANWLLLRRRFEPLDRLISAMEEIDLADPGHPLPVLHQRQRRGAPARRRLRAACSHGSRPSAARRAAPRSQAQERERRRIAQDLHDEVNQALTAVSLRLQASIEQAPPELRRELAETKRLSSQAMEELLALARQLRPAVLDDHGLLPALHSQVRDFSEQTGIRARSTRAAPADRLTPEQQLAIYRVTQESLSNIAQHAEARNVDVELSFGGQTVLRITDDGARLQRPGAAGASGSPGCASGRCSRAASCRSGRRPAVGTTVELTIA